MHALANVTKSSLQNRPPAETSETVFTEKLSLVNGRITATYGSGEDDNKRMPLVLLTYPQDDIEDGEQQFDACHGGRRPFRHLVVSTRRVLYVL